MQLLITVLVGMLNLGIAAVGAYGRFQPLLRSPGVESVTALVVSVAPFLAMGLFALGIRSKGMWVAALCLNVLSVLALLALIVFARGVGGGPIVSGLAVAGALMTLNLGYLFWRVPSAEPSASAKAA